MRTIGFEASNTICRLARELILAESANSKGCVSEWSKLADGLERRPGESGSVKLLELYGTALGSACGLNAPEPDLVVQGGDDDMCGQLSSTVEERIEAARRTYDGYEKCLAS